MGCGWQGAGASHTAVVVEFLELFMGADDSSPLQSLLFTKCRRLQSPALMPSSKIPTQQYLPNTEGDVRGGGVVAWTVIGQCFHFFSVVES